MTKTKKKKTKKKKIKSLPVLHRRCFSLWSIAVRERANNQCEICGRKRGDMGPKGKPINKIDAHHFISRNIKDFALKYDIMNGVAVCPFCHKFGVPSFHRDPITTITWLIKNSPERYHYVLENLSIRVDLENRMVMAEIENKLIENKHFDLEKLMQIEKLYPRQLKVKKETMKGSLFDNLEESSSSSSC